MLSFFPRNVLDEIWDLTESVSKGFPTYSFIPLITLQPSIVDHEHGFPFVCLRVVEIRFVSAFVLTNISSGTTCQA